MRGQEKLIDMRMKGSVPQCVWIDVDGLNKLNPAGYWHELNSAQAHIQTEEGDRISRLDLRCVRGLPCYIDGTHAASVWAMRDACIANGAQRVIATLLEHYGDEIRTVQVADTKNEFTYQREVVNG